ncbi:MAG: hypothetical protein ACFFAS_19250 [Promethearchaeota archaeon]
MTNNSEVRQLDHVERNYQILEKKMKTIMENRLEFGNTLIETELDLGAFDFIIKPIIKAFYNYWRNNDGKVGTLIQIKTTLDCGKSLVMNGKNTKEHFESIVAKNFPDYLKGDQVYRQCYKKHKNFSILKNLTKKIFIERIKEAVLLLQVKSDINDYDGLVRTVFKTKEIAQDALVKQIDLTNECIKIIERDLSILKIPTGKKILIKTLRTGFDRTREELISSLDNIYD